MQLAQALLNKGVVTPEDVARVEAEESRQRKKRREDRAKAIITTDPNVPKILDAQKEVEKALAKYEALLEASSAYEFEDDRWIRKDLKFLQAGDTVPPGASFRAYEWHKNQYALEYLASLSINELKELSKAIDDNTDNPFSINSTNWNTPKVITYLEINGLIPLSPGKVTTRQ